MPGHISVSPKSLEKLNKEILLQFAHDNALGNVNNPFNIINSAAGLLKPTRNNQLWILDIDTKDQDYVDEILIEMKEYYDRSPVNIIPTKHGCHILMRPFDLRDFTNDIDVHKNNPTILYIPKKIMRV